MRVCRQHLAPSLLGSRLLARESPRQIQLPFRTSFLSSRCLRHNATSRSPKLDATQAPTAAPAQTTLKGQPLDRSDLDQTLRRYLFYVPSFEVYGGMKGLYDYGPPGTAVQANVLDVWRKHFVVEEDMLEVDCSILTPHAVLETSGHVERFNDWMCRDPETGALFRADHFIRDALEAWLKYDNKMSQTRGSGGKRGRKGAGQGYRPLSDARRKEYEMIISRIDSYTGEELGELIRRLDLRRPGSQARPTDPEPFNLMFQTAVGSLGRSPAYLRPETAQGQLLNFESLMRYNQGAMPFASASVGKAFRNEISPRAGLLRVREFLMAEIEHYMDPESGKDHSRFHEVQDLELDLLDRHAQEAGGISVKKMAIGQAVRDGIVDNETLGYFMARIHLFLRKIGIDMRKLRFRQHMATEMAHYASDCWDAEVLTSSGWVECVGCADRSAYDLTAHSNKTGQKLRAQTHLPIPIPFREWYPSYRLDQLGPLFKKNSQAIVKVLDESTQETRETWAEQLEEIGKITIHVPSVGTVDLGSDLVAIRRRHGMRHVREYTPHIVEPSFGIGRILYALYEHVYWAREEDAGRKVLSFPIAVAPTKVAICPLITNDAFDPHVTHLSKRLRGAQITTRVFANSASIGRRYARLDELGTALAVTVDEQTLRDGTITLRERDSMKQVRGDEDRIVGAIKELVAGEKSWEDVERELPAFERPDTAADDTSPATPTDGS